MRARALLFLAIVACGGGSGSAPHVANTVEAAAYAGELAICRSEAVSSPDPWGAYDSCAARVDARHPPDSGIELRIQRTTSDLLAARELGPRK